MLQNSLLVSNTHSSLTLRKLCCRSFVVAHIFVVSITLTSLCSVLLGIDDNAWKKDVSSFSRNILSGLKKKNEFLLSIYKNLKEVTDNKNADEVCKVPSK